MNDNSNPHHVTADQTGGSSGGGTSDVQEELDAHIKNKNNPHSVTAGQVGAYTKVEVDEKLKNLPGGGSDIIYGTSVPDDASGKDGDVYVKMAEDTEYIPLEYIESSGTQYIDTKFKPNQNTMIFVDFQLLDETNHPSIFGARDNSNICKFYKTTGGNWATAYGTEWPEFSIATGALSRHSFDIVEGTAKLDGDFIVLPSVSFQIILPMFLFCSNEFGNNRYHSKMKLYSCRIYDDETLVRDFIPVKDASDVACLYDKVSQTYFYNAGTGVFASGAELPKEVAGGALYIKINGTWKLAIKGA